MNPDNTVSLYQVVGTRDTFDQAVRDAFSLLREAETRFPGWPRMYFLEVEGHAGDRSGFDADFFEFQQEFWFTTIAHFVTAFDTPLVGGLINPEPQRNDVPDELVIRRPE